MKGRGALNTGPELWVQRIWEALRKALFPARCYVCRAFFQPPGEGSRPLCMQAWVFDALMAPFLCSACRNDFNVIASPLCPQCGMMFKGRVDQDHLCGECLAEPKAFERARALFVYETTLMAAIRGFKYGGKLELAKPLGKMLLRTWLQHWDEEALDLIVPVPLYPQRMRARGFNHVYLLVHAWPEMLSTLGKRGGPPRIDLTILKRAHGTKPQTTLGRKARRQNVKDAFQVSTPARVVEQRILLVDDVYTTGATANECARVLRKAGAQKVEVLTLARAV